MLARYSKIFLQSNCVQQFHRGGAILKRILSIQGGMAGGKTTLVKRLEEHLLDVHFTYENPYPIVRKRDDLNIDIFTEEGFIANQRLFIEAEIKRYHELPNSKIILIEDHKI